MDRWKGKKQLETLNFLWGLVVTYEIPF